LLGFGWVRNLWKPNLLEREFHFHCERFLEDWREEDGAPAELNTSRARKLE